MFQSGKKRLSESVKLIMIQYSQKVFLECQNFITGSSWVNCWQKRLKSGVGPKNLRDYFGVLWSCLPDPMTNPKRRLLCHNGPRIRPCFKFCKRDWRDIQGPRHKKSTVGTRRIRVFRFCCRLEGYLQNTTTNQW